LAALACFLSLSFVYLWMVLTPVVEGPPARLLCAARFPAMRAAVDLMTFITLFSVIAIWIFSSSFAVGFAARSSSIARWRCAVGLWLLLVCALVWWGHPLASARFSRFTVVSALAVATAGIAWSFRLKRRFLPIFAALVSIAVLCTPSWVAFAKAKPDPPDARRLWSVRLENWDTLGINTSPGAQGWNVMVTSDRVVIVYQPVVSRRNESTYRLVSLDLRSGNITSALEFVGTWGPMPELHLASDGRPMLAHSRFFSAAAVSGAPSGSSGTPWPLEPGDTPFDPHSLRPTGDSLPWSEPPPVSGAAGSFFNRNVRWNGQFGRFAAASPDGRRYAFEFSDSRGDFPETLYEFFLIYDAADDAPIATVRIKDLPNDQSWFAFDSNGQYFVAGGPNTLSLYTTP